MNILICMQHQLTEEQLTELNILDTQVKIEYLKDVDLTLFNNVANSPSDIRELAIVAQEMENLCRNYNKVLLPIGSPAFMFCLASVIATRQPKTRFLFSHSERQSIEAPGPGGVVEKKIIFKHVKFIEIHM